MARPKNIRNIVNINNTNRGESELSRLVLNIPLTYGNIVTYVSVYIDNKIPFDLLLGRLWHRGDFESIDRWEDVMYLLFKDKNLEVQYGILVTSEKYIIEDPKYLYFLVQTEKCNILSEYNNSR